MPLVSKNMPPRQVLALTLHTHTNKELLNLLRLFELIIWITLSCCLTETDQFQLTRFHCICLSSHVPDTFSYNNIFMTLKPFHFTLGYKAEQCGTHIAACRQTECKQSLHNARWLLRSI